METVADLVQSLKRWDKPALIYKTGFRTYTFSYRDLYDEILKTAALLESEGLRKGDTLLLWGLNSPQWGIVFLAAAVKGVVIVPIDFMATGEFVATVHKQVQAKAIFHSEFKIVPDIGIQKFALEHLSQFTKDVKPEKPKTMPAADDLLEIVYTSGTTGDPKGVLISHGNLMSNVTAITKMVNARPEQTFLSLLPLSHLFEQNPGFLSPLSRGCTIVYMRGLRPNLIFRVLAEVKVTNIVIVPRLLKLFETSIRHEVEAKGKTATFNKLLRKNVPKSIKKLLFKPVHKKFGTHFEYFVSGGAPLSDDLALFWNGLGFDIVQGYGLTECAPVLTINSLETGRVGSVGQAVPGVELKLNSGGELYAKGPNITKGYFKRPDKTAELFDGGWMKTGDIGTIDDDGFLFLKGRAKDVIVTGAGMNVYPEDVEAALLRQAGVKESCVIGLPSEQGEQVHAEILLSDPKADVKHIVAQANQGLNEAQRITSFGIWPKDDFPRTTTMKIKKPLVLADVIARASRPGAGASESAGQSKLTTIIADVCDVDGALVKPQSSLALDLHLTSVNRIELVARIEQEFNLDLNEDAITASTTVAELETMIKKREKVPPAVIFHRWLLSPPLRIIRAVFNTLIAENIIRIFVRRTIVGRDNIKNLDGPVIFIANHVGYFDAPAIIMSLPWSIRNKIAPAAWREYFESEGKTFSQNRILRRMQLYFYLAYASVMVNIYPFPKKSGFKNSLEYTGELLDKGWNILFFPEGDHSPSGKLLPFRSGIGLIVKEMKVPIVPIKHSGFEKIMAGDPIQLPRFGRATITIGKPVMLDDRKSIPELTQELQDIIANM